MNYLIKLTKAATGDVLLIKLFAIKTTVLKSLLNKVAGRKGLQHRCFPVNIAKFLTPILKNICERLLLK